MIVGKQVKLSHCSVLQEQWTGGGARRDQGYIQCYTLCTGQ